MCTAPRQCYVCGDVATCECYHCVGRDNLISAEATSHCVSCMTVSHGHEDRRNHKSNPIDVPVEFGDQKNVPRIFMELFAVVCIETSHYVSFVKAGSGPAAPWCFFDSMADRKGLTFVYCNFFLLIKILMV